MNAYKIAASHARLLNSRVSSFTLQLCLIIKSNFIILCSPSWNQAGNIDSNYEHIGFAADVNAGTGRNRRSDILANKVPQIPDHQLDASLDEDLKVAMARQRNSGKAPPKRPTPRQRHLIERLLAAHGSNIAAMFKDRKLNAMQHSEGVLQSLIESCDYWRGKTGVDFRAPIKSI